MGTQGKGILGNPSGKIGNIHIYKRLGKSIIQANSSIKDKYLRAWPLLKYRLTTRLNVYWQLMTPTEQALWNAFIVGSETAKEAFIRTSLDYVFTNRAQNLTGALWSATSFVYQTHFSFKGNWLDPYLSIYYLSGVEPFSSAAETRFKYSFYLPDSTKVDKTANVYSGFSNGKKLAAYDNTVANSILMICRVRQFTPYYSSWYVIVDTYNKKFDYKSF